MLDLEAVEVLVFEQVQRQLDALCGLVGVVEVLSDQTLLECRLARVRRADQQHLVRAAVEARD